MLILVIFNRFLPIKFAFCTFILILKISDPFTSFSKSVDEMIGVHSIVIKFDLFI